MASSEDFKKLYELYQTEGVPNGGLVYYRLKMFDILVKAAEGQAMKGRHNGG